MGKRRDRRQQQASSRRVKLDLSTEDVLSPSETPGPSEVLGSTLGEEIKAGARNKEAANDNPLSLLGQYSDDEADEDDNPGVSPTNNTGNETGDDFARSQDEQENAAAIVVPGKILDERDTTSSLGLGDHKHDLKSFSESEARLQYMAKTENQWQAVLHEETGEYYYWNIQTGETTWVKPVSLENRNAGELGSSENLPVDFDFASVKSSELVQREKHWKADQGESGELDSISTCENINLRVESCLLKLSQDTEPGNGKTCLESNASLEPELDSLKIGTKLASDTATAVEKSQDSEDPECRAGSDDAIRGPHTKKVQGEEMDEETLVPIKLDGEDVNFEATETIQGASEGSLEHEKRFEEDNTKSCDRNFPLAGESLQETELANTTSDFQDASECPMKLYTEKTIQEKMASFAEKGDALQQRLNILARDSLGGVSRHAHMALQAEARITDWKAFCALGFDPEACLSFMQNELTQLESVLIAEEAIRQKVVQSTTALEVSHEVRPTRNDADWSLNWGYYQQESDELWKQGQPTEFLGNGDDVEEGEIRATYGEVHTAYSSISEGLTTVNNPEVSNLAGGEDVDMDVDMEVDDEVEAEPAVPGMSSDVPSHDAPVSYSYPYSLQGCSDVGALAPVDSSLVGDPTHYFPAGLSGDSWAPPLPPDDEWAPPPPGETEPVPPPPPDEPPPLPPDAPRLVETVIMPCVPPEVQVHYLVPEYRSGNNQHTCTPDYQSVLDASMYAAYVEDVPGVVYSNSPQTTDALKVEQPYMVASVSSSAFNGWSAPVLASTALSLVNPVMASEPPVKSTTYVPSVTASSTTTDSSAGGAVSEAKKPVLKGKVKKRTHSVAAAPMLNKKVSSLVNKWKQAKEELHGGEEDEDDKDLYDLEMLEKKRQKEIEEWRRQQIASGDALDNANFQPLGTIDWRERVKRAKKTDPKEGKEGDKGSETSLSTLDDQNQEALKLQKPNLADLSKGLPAGWQAYWDEVSGEVYYGNLITQETTWDRPVT